MEISLHRTRALLGEKIIRLRYLEQSLERADPQTAHHSPSNTLSEPLGATDSSGFSGSDLDLSSSMYWLCVCVCVSVTLRICITVLFRIYLLY